jgi:hypothetical protein
MHAVRLSNEGVGRSRLQDANVPTGFTFGVELETFMPSSVSSNDVQSAPTRAGLPGWRIKSDNSIVCNHNLPSCYCVELVSSPLSGAAGMQQIYKLVKAVKPLNPSVNKSCGLHVHVSAAGLLGGSKPDPVPRFGGCDLPGWLLI